VGAVVSQKQILIVEDEAIVAEQLSDTLKRNGYNIVGVSVSGRDAIAMAKENRPDLVLMDVRIEGDLNGIETAIVIQGHYNEVIPIVFLTAMPSSKFPVLAAVEPYVYVNKPIRDEDLLAAVERSLLKHSQGQ